MSRFLAFTSALKQKGNWIIHKHGTPCRVRSSRSFYNLPFASIRQKVLIQKRDGEISALLGQRYLMVVVNTWANQRAHSGCYLFVKFLDHPAFFNSTSLIMV